MFKINDIIYENIHCVNMIDKTCITELIVIDFKINYDHNSVTPTSTIEKIFNCSTPMKEIFNKYYKPNEIATCTMHCIENDLHENVCTYFTLDKYPLLYFLFVELSNLKYNSNIVYSTLCSNFVNNPIVKTELIDKFIKVLLDPTSSINYGTTILTANHYHYNGNVVGLDINTIKIHDTILKMISIPENEQSVVNALCTKIDNRDNYERYVIDHILTKLVNEFKRFKDVHDYIIEIFAANKDNMYSINVCEINKAYQSKLIKEQRAKLEETRTELKEKDAKLEEKDAKLEEKDAKLEEKDAKLEEKDAIIEELKAKLSKYEHLDN